MQVDTWRRFVNGDKEILTSLPDKIASSWRKCYNEQVDPYLVKPKTVLTENELKSCQRQHQILIHLVKNESKHFKGIMHIKQPIFILTDENGTILWREGNYQARSYANEIYFNVGSRWSELDVGTNAIGMALENKQAEFMSLDDHYAIASRRWSCAAAPIFDSNQDLIGILDISTYNNNSVQEAMLFLTTITQRISNAYIREELNQKMALLQYAGKNLDHEILCDLHKRIVYVPDEYQDYFEMNQEIQGQLPRDLLYEEREIIFNNALVGYRYKLYKKLSEENEFHYVGVPSSNTAYQQFSKKVQKLAQSKVPVHVYGESGSGKEVIAKTLHMNSPYRQGPLITVNCGSISDTLLESELFGYAPGAFTGANQEGHVGKILQANGGTLFLDEIDSMPWKMQTALLRVLEEKQVVPLNGQPQPVDFRLVSASNQDLRKRVLAKEFREDLFYRIYVGKLSIPPLRERLEDLLPLVDRFCEKRQWQIAWKERLLQIARTYHWPGNIREFNNFLERLYIFYAEEEPTNEQILELITLGTLSEKETKAQESIENQEREEILKALKSQHYHVTNAAKSLGISRATLYRKIKEYHIEY